MGRATARPSPLLGPPLLIHISLSQILSLSLYSLSLYLSPFILSLYLTPLLSGENSGHADGSGWQAGHRRQREADRTPAAREAGRASGQAQVDGAPLRSLSLSYLVGPRRRRGGAGAAPWWRRTSGHAGGVAGAGEVAARPPGQPGGGRARERSSSPWLLLLRLNWRRSPIGFWVWVWSKPDPIAPKPDPLKVHFHFSPCKIFNYV